MKASEELFQLINALTKSEKRYVLVYIKNHAYKEYNSYFILIDLISKQESYDEVEIKNYLEKKKFKKILSHFAVFKKRLYDLIMKGVRSFGADQNIENKVLNALQDINFLYERNLLKQAEKILLKTKELALRYEKYPELIALYRYEKMLQSAKPYSEKVFESDKELKKNENNVLDKIKEINHQWFLMIEMNYLRHKDGLARNEENFKKREDVIHSEIERNVDLSDNFRASAFWHTTKMVYYASKHDLENSLAAIKEGLAYMEESMIQILEKPMPYISRQHHFISIARHMENKEEEIEQMLNKIDNFIRKLPIEQNENKLIKVKELQLQYKTEIEIKKGEFRNALNFIDQYEKLSKNKHANSHITKIFILNKLRLISLIGTEDYDKALDIIAILLENKDKLPIDTFSLVIILDLICHFELGNIRLLEYKVKSAYRYLYKRNHLHKFEKVLLNFIGENIKNSNNKRETAAFFHSLREELLKLREESFEFKYMEDFDFISWLNSKINNESFSEVVKRQYNSHKNT
ncbi:MAG: hypothetical protein EA412_02400 [Chitinophagaceae bacterium]|nr:MAG: hypothetical protein EA412_02400 [Chitinophagaceae bacterium]